jgi:membrane-associated protease RseP (regulator of RpoE activity)
MLFTLTFGLFIASIVAHEFGHAVVMHRYGIRLLNAGIGLPWGPYITLPRKWFAWVGKGFEMRIYLLLLGAYVRPRDETAVAALPYEQKAHVYGAGIIANILFAIGCIALLALIDGGSGSLKFRFLGTLPIMGLLLIGLSLAGGIVFFSKKICAYLFPIGSFLVLYLVIWLFSGMSSEQVVNNFGGIITIGQLAYKASVGVPQAIIFGGIISFAIGISNLLPIYPADGGLIVSAILERWLPPSAVEIFNRIGVGAFIILIGLAILGDVYHLFVPL